MCLENVYLCEISLFKPMLLIVLCETARRGDLDSSGIATLAVMVIQMPCTGRGHSSLGRVEQGRELALKPAQRGLWQY